VCGCDKKASGDDEGFLPAWVIWRVRKSGSSLAGGYKKWGGPRTKNFTLLLWLNPLDPHLSTLTKSPSTMFRKLFVPVFLLLAFAAHSALGIITSITGPTRVLAPPATFTVAFHTKPPKDVEFCVAFGLNPGRTPPPDHDLGRFVLTKPGTCLQLGVHGITGTGTFLETLSLPANFPTTPRPRPYTLTAAVFRLVSWMAAAMSPLIG